jgi:hypothetical protein
MRHDVTEIACEMITHGESMKLPSVVCECGKLLHSEEFVPKKVRGAPPARGFQSCLRRCDDCGIGYSNADQSSRHVLQRIYKTPLLGLPEWLSEDLDYALDECLNRSHAKKKRYDFHSFASEDNVTWVVMRTLQRSNLLGTAFGFPGTTPTMLLWGVPIPRNATPGAELQAKLIRVLGDDLGERPAYYTEPDVILDFDHLIVFIEAKLTSNNDQKKHDYGGWKKYVSASAFRNPDLAIQSKLYQLARNWRIARELADGRSFQVVNLAPAFPELAPASRKEKHCSLAKFRASVDVTRKQRLTLMTWKQVCEPIRNNDWLEKYGQKRGLW